MAYSSLDPVTGAPVFLSADAPDPGVNESQVAEYAAEVGTRLIGTTAERTAYAYARDGLRWRDTTDGGEYEYRSGGWVLVNLPATDYEPTVTGISLGTSPSLVARYWVSDGRVKVMVRIVLGSTPVATGLIYVSLPAGLAANTALPQVGAFTALGPSGARKLGTAQLDTSSRVLFVVSDGSLLDNSSFAWSGSNELRFEAEYARA